MKIKLTLFLIVFALVDALAQTKSNSCDIIPYATYNPTIFDWQSHGGNGKTPFQYNPIYRNNDAGITNTMVNSPYDSEQNWNVKDLYETLYTTNLDVDISTIAGWELVNYRMGSSTNPIYYPPMVVLYNRFQSILRVFALIPPNLTYDDNSATSYLISATFSQGLGNGKSALFSKAEQVLPSVMDFNPAHTISVVNKYQNQISFQWLRADFPVMFDPCTCRNPQQNGVPLIYIFFDKINKANVNLVSQLVGTITGIANGSSESNISSYDDASAIFSALGRIDGSAKGNLALSGSATISTKRNSVGTKVLKKQSAKYRSKQTTICKNSPEYQDPVGAISAVGSLALGGEVSVAMEAIGLISYFASSASNSSTNSDVYTERSDSRISATINTSGTIESQDLSMYYTIMLPGSNHIAADPKTNPLAPFYDNPLGVFNLAYTPTLEVVEYKAQKYSNVYKCTALFHSCSTRGATISYEADVDVQLPKIREYRMKRDETIKYMINPAAGLNLVSIKSSLVFEYPSISTFYQQGKDNDYYITSNLYEEKNSSAAGALTGSSVYNFKENSFFCGPVIPSVIRTSDLATVLNNYATNGFEIERGKEGSTLLRDYVFATPFLNLNCLKDSPLRFFGTQDDEFPKPVLKLLVTLRKKDFKAGDQDILQVYTFAVNESVINNTANYQVESYNSSKEFPERTINQLYVKSFDAVSNWAGNSFNFPAVVNINQPNTATANTTIKAMELINVTASITPAANIKESLISGGEIINSGEVVLSGEVEEFIESPGSGTNYIYPASCSQAVPEYTNYTQLCGESTYTSKAYASREDAVASSDSKVLPKPTSNLTAHPNPVWSTTTLSYKVAQKGNVKLYITDGMGQKIEEVINLATHEAGEFEVKYSNQNLSSGMYFVVLEADGSKETIKLAVVR